MSSFKEIVTKAIIGKAKRTNSDTFSLTPEEVPNTILGCWVINHTFTGTKSSDGKINVSGAFDVNVWYSYDTDKKTAVATQRFNYTDKMSVPLKENASNTGTTEIIVRCLKQPTVSNVSIKNDSVILDIEKEMGVELIGDAKVKISVEDDFDDYEEIVDEQSIEKIIDEVDENYLEKK